MKEVLIQLRQIKLFGHHGVLPEEEAQGQFFVLDLELIARHPATDELAHAVDYGQVALALAAAFKEKRFQLLEMLGEHLLDALKPFQGIYLARLTLAKPNPPIPLEMQGVSVTLERQYPGPM